MSYAWQYSGSGKSSRHADGWRAGIEFLTWINVQPCEPTESWPSALNVRPPGDLTGADLFWRGGTLKHVLLALVAFLMVSCDESSPQGSGWRVIGQLTGDGLRAKFVEIAIDKAHDRPTYDNAVMVLCKDVEICILGFFLHGDRIPETQSAKNFYDRGGWSDYPVLATWWSNRNSGVANFTTWDCERAGIEGAPLEALCGPGVGEAYGALLAVAGRAGMAQACKWPPNDMPAIAAVFIAELVDSRRKEQFQNAYNDLLAAAKRGPDNFDDCKRLRPKVEQAAKQARIVLSSPRGH